MNKIPLLILAAIAGAFFWQSGAAAIDAILPTAEELAAYPVNGLRVRFTVDRADLAKMELIPRVELDVQLKHARNSRYLNRRRFTLDQLMRMLEESDAAIEFRFPAMSGVDIGGPVVLAFYLDSNRGLTGKNMFGEYAARRRSLLAVSEPFVLPGEPAALSDPIPVSLPSVQYVIDVFTDF